MEIKLIELRDAGTFIPMLAIKLVARDEGERWLIARAGYGSSIERQSEYVLFGPLDPKDGTLHYDPCSWPGMIRTYRVAHEWLITHWDEVKSGKVVDVEYISGLSEKPKVSEYLDVIKTTK